MKMISQTFSLTAKFDHVLTEGGMVAIVEVRRDGPTYRALWWVAGLTDEGRLAIGYQAQFALPISNPLEAELHLGSVAPSIFGITKASLSAGGVKPIPLMDGPEITKALAAEFLNVFESEKLFETKGLELNVSTGLQYEFCQLLKVSKPVEFMAEYLNLPVTTVRQRITWARNKGVLPKMRSQGVKLDA